MYILMSRKWRASHPSFTFATTAGLSQRGMAWHDAGISYHRPAMPPALWLNTACRSSTVPALPGAPLFGSLSGSAGLSFTHIFQFHAMVGVSAVPSAQTHCCAFEAVSLSPVPFFSVRPSQQDSRLICIGCSKGLAVPVPQICQTKLFSSLFLMDTSMAPNFLQNLSAVS